MKHLLILLVSISAHAETLTLQPGVTVSVTEAAEVDWQFVDSEEAARDVRSGRLTQVDMLLRTRFGKVSFDSVTIDNQDRDGSILEGVCTSLIPKRGSNTRETKIFDTLGCCYNDGGAEPEGC